MYATTTTGKREHVQQSKDSRVILAMHISGVEARIIQTTETTVDEYLGLSYTDAQSLCTASESSTLNGTTRAYLGSAKLTVSTGGTSVWNTVEACFGTRITSQLSRMGDTNHYRVTKTTQVMTITNSGGTMQQL